MSDLSQNNGSGAITLINHTHCQIFESSGRDSLKHFAAFVFRELMSGS